MGCGCRKNLSSLRSRPPDLRGQTIVTLEYVGDNQGSRTVSTPLGNQYKFDGKDRTKFIVLKDDVYYFTQQLSQFKVI